MFRLVASIAIYFVGKFVINKICKLFTSNKSIVKLNATANIFIASLIKGILYSLLVITIIGVLGVPMASIVAVVASCAAAIGLALQGSLSNFAGGIMILIFKPFKVGDYIQTAGVEGSVRSINVFYTIIMTVDNKCVNIPNGSLMNNVVTNYSSEEFRRVDVTFKTSKDEDVSKILSLLEDAILKLDGIDLSRDKFIGFEGMDDESYKFQIKLWTKNTNYWNLYYAIQKEINCLIVENNIKSPYKRISNV